MSNAQNAGQAQSSTSTTERRTFKVGARADLSKMSQEQLLAYAQGLEQKLDRNSTITARFNDGSEATASSPRDSGTISVYGFGRNPISLYPSQWIRLFQEGSPVVKALLEAQKAHIEAYLAKKTGRSEQLDLSGF